MPFNRLQLNIISNILGQAWYAMMLFVFTPLCIKFVGMESYGLFAFYATIQNSIQVFDLGMAQTMNREMAKYSAEPEQSKQMLNFVRTMEISYVLIGIVIGAALYMLSPIIADRWLKAESIPGQSVENIIMIMSLILSLQWPISLYHGGLLGLQRHPILNALKMSMITLSWGGGVLILWLVSPTIKAFFIWQIGVTFLHLILSRMILRRSLPKSSEKSELKFEFIQNIWRFAAGMSGITISAIILTQLDKLILSKMLSLKMFGYYSLAAILGNGLLLFITPVFNSLYPRFSYLVAAGDETKLKNTYHLGTQLMAVLILPLAGIISCFSFEILLLWTSNLETARFASGIVSILVIGTALNGMMNLPYALQLAHGWTSIGLRINTCFIVIFIPMIYFLTKAYGPMGAASVWVILNVMYMIIGVPLTHQKLMKGETWRWISRDIVVPLIATLASCIVARHLVTSPMSPLKATLSLGGVFVFVYLSVAISTPVTRTWLSKSISRFPSKLT
jgi:O-antigen/teichoic acid export membrane protein